MLLVCFKQTQKKHFSIFFFSERYKLFLISLAPRARAALLTFQVITGNVSPCKALVFPDRLLPSVTPLCAQSHYHKSHRMLPRQLHNLATPGSALKRGQIPHCNTPSPSVQVERPEAVEDPDLLSANQATLHNI